MANSLKSLKGGEYVYATHRYNRESKFIRMPALLLNESRIYDHNEKEGILQLNANPKQLERVLSGIDTSKGIHIVLVNSFCLTSSFSSPMYIDGVRKIMAREGCENIAYTPLTEMPKKKGEEDLFCRLIGYFLR
ncbi:MAG: hypothetical protein V1886_02305 [archaeon]